MLILNNLNNNVLKNNALKSHNMTSGSVYRQLISYSVPLCIGSLFQLLYNVIDAIIVGRFVSSEALAAVGSTGMLINIYVYFFLGFSVGAGVLIGQCFGSKDNDKLREAVQTTVAVTLVMCVVLTVVGYFTVSPMLKIIRVPDNVFNDSAAYLRIYFLGISGLLIYSIGGEIMRAVGNTSLPLYFLIFSSVVNIFLDLFFVLGFDAGVKGVAWATVIAQLLSAVLILIILTTTHEVYHLEWRGIHINKNQLKTILSTGMPAGIQSVITACANLMAQTYINALGSACMAGWSCFNKILSVAMLPTGALAQATTAFISQNAGAEKNDRIKEGVFKSNILSVIISTVVAVITFAFAKQFMSIFTDDSEVIRFGAVFIHWIIFSLIYYSLGNNISNAMIGLGDSKGPTRIKLAFFVGLRFVLLYIVAVFIPANPIAVSVVFPISWAAGTIGIFIYYKLRWAKRFGQTDNVITD